MLACKATRETHYKDLFEKSPVSLWEEDFSQVKAYLDQLSSRGVVNLEDHLARYPEVAVKCAELVRVLDVNDAALVLHRARDKSSLLESLNRTFIKQSFTAFQQELVAIWNRETRLQMDTVVKTLDGDIIDVSVKWSVLPESKMTYDRVIVSLVNISERKHIAKQLREAHAMLEHKMQERTRELSEANAQLQREIAERQAVHESLRQREAELRSLLDNSPDMILKTDPNMKIIWANQTAMEMNRHCIGMTCYQAFPGRDNICEGCPVAKALKTGRLERGVMYQPVSKTAPDEQYWENIGVPHFDENGEIMACIEISRNITDRMQITKTLEKANQELEAFAYSVSHDLRAPLRHIDGFLELLQQSMGERLDEPSQHYFNNISSAARHMGQLIDDLLAFSRTGRHELSQRPVNLNALVHEIIQELEPETENRVIHWHIANLPAVNGDQALLRLVLINLLSNALKFTRVCAQADIEIGYQINKKETILYIRDNGVGFDMAYADKLFGVFQRLHRADEFEGTGIGLANVGRIINRHGGKVWAEGKVDQGATFYFSLPKYFKEA